MIDFTVLVLLCAHMYLDGSILRGGIAESKGVTFPC